MSEENRWTRRIVSRETRYAWISFSLMMRRLTIGFIALRLRSAFPIEVSNLEDMMDFFFALCTEGEMCLSNTYASLDGFAGASSNLR